MQAVVTPNDLKSTEIIGENGWNPCEFIDYREKDNDEDGSTDCTFVFKVIDGPEKSKQTQVFMNEKFLKYGKELWTVLGIPYDKDKGYNLSTEVFKSKLGTKLRVQITRGKSKAGREFNEAKGYLPLATQ